MRGIPLLPVAPLTLLGLTEVSKKPVEDVAPFLAAILNSNRESYVNLGKDPGDSGRSGIYIS